MKAKTKRPNLRERIATARRRETLRRDIGVLRAMQRRYRRKRGTPYASPYSTASPGVPLALSWAIDDLRATLEEEGNP
jgi:hypothetical protein